MDNAPLDLVVYEKALEVGKEHPAFAIAEDIEVAVMGIVLAGRIVPEERNAHVGVFSALGGSRHRSKRRGGHKADMKQKLSHLNVK